MSSNMRISIKAALFFIVVVIGGCSEEEPGPIDTARDKAMAVSLKVETQNGLVVGSQHDESASMWLGIPYAAPPVGPNRWRPPQPAAERSEPLTADKLGNACIQPAHPLGGAPEGIEEGSIWGSEDCLYLNIYAPANPDNKDLPVMFWIHGGSNVVGHSGAYDGSVLAQQQNVIVVTHNYRLGPFGWWYHRLTTALKNAEDASGNYALLDSIYALKWVRDNIAFFGGDPNKVTIFGESAGGTNVLALIASPYGRGLFAGAISQSGNASLGVSKTWAANYKDDLRRPGSVYSTSEMLLRFVSHQSEDCDRNCARVQVASMNASEQAAIMRATDAADIIKLYGDFDDMLRYMPRIILDGFILPKQGILAALADRETGSLVPVMLGTNKDETKLFMALNSEFVFMVGDVPLWRRDADMYDLQAEYGTAVWKLYGVDLPAMHLRQTRTPVWTYRFDWDELPDSPFVEPSDLLGAAHAFELPFVFGNFQTGVLTDLIASEDNAEGRLALSERMMAYWAAFARDFAPNQGADGKGVVWEPFNPKSNHTFLHLDTGEEGIRMSDALLTFDGLVQQLAEDERIEDSQVRCEIFNLAFGIHLEAYVSAVQQDIQAAAKKLGCKVQI